ncbi:MAG TPA: ABC transporter permease [Chloroflexota bacterium]|jgi:putative ABC transport system permease protein|nr:ABC transporter permease [Chloroflexota bacterium]
MNVFESLRVAIRALGANKLRTVLTMLGIIIGVGAVIALMSVGRGAQVQITSSIQSMGTNLLFVRPNFTERGGVRSGQGQAPTLTFEDALALVEPGRAPSVALVAPELNTFGQLIAGPQNYNTRVVGVTAEYQEVRNFRPSSGEFVTRAHVDGLSTVIVLGATVAENLFGEADPVGQTVKLSIGGRTGLNFRVVGVMERKGGSGFGNQDDQAFVPLTTMQSRLFGQRTARGLRNVSVINVQAVDEGQMKAAVEQIGQVLRERHRVNQDDFVVQSQEDFLQVAGQITGVMTALLGSIAGISLVVGGIGIMNIMLVSVTERTREIGIRKAVGARRRDILAQFLTEAVVVSLVGGGIGVALGVLLSTAIAQIDLGGQRLETLVAPDAVLLAFGVSAAIGLFFGIYPAARAARLNPIEALRYE